MDSLKSCPLKGNLFSDEDLKTLNNNTISGYYSDILKKLRKRVKPSDRAWIAGIVDGEGYLGIRIKRKLKNGKRGLGIQIAVESTTPLMQLNIFKILKIGKVKNRKKTTGFFIQNYNEAIVFIDLILPYLVVKKQIAIFFKEFCLRRVKKKPISDYDYYLYENVKALNEKNI